MGTCVGACTMLHQEPGPHNTHPAAAYGGQEAIAALGNQIFCMIKCGQQPPEVISLRAPYEATVQALRGEISKVAGVPADQLQLFHRGHELPSDDTRTLLDLDLHTGFSLHCYNLVREEKRVVTQKNTIFPD